MVSSWLECHGLCRGGGRISAIGLAALTLTGCSAMTQKHYANPFPAPVELISAPPEVVPAQMFKRRIAAPAARPRQTTDRRAQPAGDIGRDSPEPASVAARPPPASPRTPSPLNVPDTSKQPTAPLRTQPLARGGDTVPDLPWPHPGGDLESRMAALDPTPETEPGTSTAGVPIETGPAAPGPNTQQRPADAPEREIAGPPLPSQLTPEAAERPARPETPALTTPTPTLPAGPTPEPSILNRPAPPAVARAETPALPEAEPSPQAEPVPEQRTGPAASPESAAPANAPSEKPQERAPTARGAAAPPGVDGPDTTLPRSLPASPEPPAEPAPARPTREVTVAPPPLATPPTPAPVEPARPEPPQAEAAPVLSDVACPQIATGGPDPDCQSALTRLLLDTSSAWVDRPPTATDYVSGARLVAYAQLRNRLNCRQLQTGLDEAQTAIIALRAAIDGETTVGRPTERLERTRELALEARARLESANGARC